MSGPHAEEPLMVTECYWCSADGTPLPRYHPDGQVEHVAEPTEVGPQGSVGEHWGKIHPQRPIIETGSGPGG